jgi:hypothetical protein
MYYFLNQNLEVVFKYKVKVKYKNIVLFLTCITIKQKYFKKLFRYYFLF